MYIKDIYLNNCKVKIVAEGSDEVVNVESLLDLAKAQFTVTEIHEKDDDNIIYCLD